jgi:uncharacterized membrane protein
MDLIIYIAVAIPIAGFLMRHLVVTRDTYNDAIKKNTPAPTNRWLIIQGMLFILFAIIILLRIADKTWNWGATIAVVVIIAEGIFDLWHGLRLKGACRIRE